MDNGMIDPISSMGRAVQSRTSNMTPEQVAQVAKQYQDMGLLSFDNVVTLKQQLDRMKQAGQPQPPPRTTVVQDMQQQMGGITSLPSNVGNEKSYARGGIVAFAGGELVGPYTDEQLRLLGEQAAKEANEAALKGAKGPAEKISATQKGKNFFTKPRTLAGAKGLASRFYPAAALMTGAAEAGQTLTGDPMPIENIRNYYADKGLLPESERVGSRYESPLMSSLDDAGLRTLAMAQKMATLGMTGPQRTAGAASQAPTTEAPGAPSRDYSEYMTEAAGGEGGGAGFGGIASLMRGPELSEYEQVQRRIAEREAQYAKDIAGGRMPFYQQAETDARQMGIGKATEEGRAMVAEKEAKLPEDERRGKWLAAAEAFFGMAEAGGESGSTFWGAAGKGGTKGVAAYNKLLNELDLKEERLDAQKLQLAQMEEAQKMGHMQLGDARYSRKEAQVEAAQAQKDSVLLKVADVRNEFALRKMTVEAQVAIAEIQAGNDSKAKKVLNEFTEYWQAAVRAGDEPAAEFFRGKIEDLTSAMSGTFLTARYKMQNGPLAGMVPGGAAAPADSGGVEFVGSRPDR